jgi:hypothetical protein
MQVSTIENDPRVGWKRAFLSGMITMACEDADDVTSILIQWGYVQQNPDGSYKSCSLPLHTIEALGLLVRLVRWERLNFHGHREVGIPSADDVSAHIAKRMRRKRPSPELERWLQLRWQVYRDQTAWLSDPGLIVRTSEDAEDDFVNALAAFLVSATRHQ